MLMNLFLLVWALRKWISPIIVFQSKTQYITDFFKSYSLQDSTMSKNQPVPYSKDSLCTYLWQHERMTRIPCLCHRGKSSNASLALFLADHVLTVSSTINMHLANMPYRVIGLLCSDHVDAEAKPANQVASGKHDDAGVLSASINQTTPQSIHHLWQWEECGFCCGGRVRFNYQPLCPNNIVDASKKLCGKFWKCLGWNGNQVVWCLINIRTRNSIAALLDKMYRLMHTE